MKRTSLKRGTSTLKRSPLAQTSSKRRKQNRERAKVLAAMREEDPMCRRCRQRRATDGHELLRRSAAGSITDRANIRLVCRPCHDEIGADVPKAIAEGWQISRFRRR